MLAGSHVQMTRLTPGNTPILLPGNLATSWPRVPKPAELTSRLFSEDRGIRVFTQFERGLEFSRSHSPGRMMSALQVAPDSGRTRNQPSLLCQGGQTKRKEQCRWGRTALDLNEAKGNGLAHGNYSRLGLPASLPKFMCLSAKWEQSHCSALETGRCPSLPFRGPEAKLWNLRAGNQSSSLLRGLQQDQGWNSGPWRCSSHHCSHPQTISFQGHLCPGETPARM